MLIGIEARRFRCTVTECPRRIFTERLPAIAAGPWSRRTGRLGEIQRHLGLALGGRAGARLAERLAMPVEALRDWGCQPIRGIPEQSWTSALKSRLKPIPPISRRSP